MTLSYIDSAHFVILYLDRQKLFFYSEVSTLIVSQFSINFCSGPLNRISDFYVTPFVTSGSWKLEIRLPLNGSLVESALRKDPKRTIVVVSGTLPSRSARGAERNREAEAITSLLFHNFTGRRSATRAEPSPSRFSANLLKRLRVLRCPLQLLSHGRIGHRKTEASEL